VVWVWVLGFGFWVEEEEEMIGGEYSKLPFKLLFLFIEKSPSKVII
jgi:hypothetical protein